VRVIAGDSQGSGSCGRLGKEAVVGGCRVCEGEQERQQGLYDVTKRAKSTGYHEERVWDVYVCGCMQCAGR